eukprot:CCRYP_002949-RA/>CCRYP_002949-RA protein AED:0.20 eAED:0.29 QI:0/0/0/1/0/0/2/0/78
MGFRGGVVTGGGSAGMEAGCGDGRGAWAGGAGFWSSGSLGGLDVGVVAHLAKRLRRAVMAWSCESREEAGASAMAEER